MKKANPVYRIRIEEIEEVDPQKESGPHFVESMRDFRLYNDNSRKFQSFLLFDEELGSTEVIELLGSIIRLRREGKK